MVWVIQRLSSLRSHLPVGVAQLWDVRPQHPTNMKITIISLMLVLLAVGCSKKESASAPLQFTVARSDMTLANITTNVYKGNAYYIIQIKLSSAKQAELFKLAQQHPGGEIEVVLGSGIHTMKMPAKTLKLPIQWALSFRSLDDAVAAEKELKDVIQQ